MKFAVTGSAGFIGSNLVDRLLADGHDVVGLDNFSTGKEEFLAQARGNARFTQHVVDVYDADAVKRALSPDMAAVFHLAANADVRFGLEHPRRDLEQNTIATWNVLEGVRAHGIKHILFSSTGSVYGESAVIPTPEDCPFPVQTSLYGASKLAAEALVSAYAEGYGIRGTIFRFVSIMGPRYQHGHVLDFVARLLDDPTTLKVLGNGTQRKSYLHVDDCVGAILAALARPDARKLEIYNLGTDEYVTVNDSIGVICEELKVKPTMQYTGGDRGWVGDNPFIFLSTAKIRGLGWTPRLTIRDSVRDTVKYLLANRWLMKEAR